MQQEPTTPNLARVYDYMLDGTHNYPVDRVIGEKNKVHRPHLVKFVKLNRAFLRHAGQRFAEASFPAYIDLATGLPTEGALHELVPESSKILYNDRDPLVISYARNILEQYARQNGRVKPTDHITYVQSDIQDIETILRAAESMFGVERRVGVCLIGVAYFLSDETLSHVAQRLYEWAAPGSMLAVTSFDTEQDNGWREILEEYRKMGVDGFPRSPAYLQQVLQPWAGQFTPLEDIIEADLGTQVAEPHERGRMGYAGMFHRA